jgi:hypothetical protein
MKHVRTVALGTAGLAVLAASTAVMTATPAVAADPTNPFPTDCAWAGEVSPTASNVYYPDAGATYWVTAYDVDAGDTIEVDGTYPDARYASLVTYPNSGGYFTTDSGVDSWLTDYQIKPDKGSENPFTKQGKGAEPGGDFTVEVKQDVGKHEKNALPMAPDLSTQGETGYLVYRVYEPAGGDYGAVDLPELTIHHDDGTSTALDECSEPVELGQVPPDTVPPSDATQFARQPLAGAFPNPDNSYLTLDYRVPDDGDVLVIRGKAPEQAGGQAPVTWPSRDADLRYWSMCSNTMTNPYPVVDCATDDQTALDEDGYYTYVVGTEDQRAAVEAIPGATFISTSSTDPDAVHKLVLRNLVPSDDFDQAIANVPEDSTPEEAAAVMGDYYPQTYTVGAASLTAEGLSTLQ